MSRWEYDLKGYGTKLRELITEGDSSKENCENILKQIVVCCEYLQTKLTDEDTEEYGYDINDIIDCANDTKYYLEEDNDDFNEGEINGILEEFYGLMDSMRVWVAF